ncbi:MAG: hypothetical protein LBT83_10045 [Tannerella sp.]|jgi:hypothetical protein|nr:hypothetical protein [Tannerella sp.]
MSFIYFALRALRFSDVRQRTFMVVGLLFVAIPFLLAQQKQKGYPEKGDFIDVLPGFIHPPKGYGNVPFYWWNGDSLNRQRLSEQLDLLSESATEGFAVSYVHLDPLVDTTEMKDGYGMFGKTEPGRPRVFSEEWWDTWSWFAAACARKNMGAGLDDYTVGWTGNGYYADELAAMPKFRGYQGELAFNVDSAEGGTTWRREAPQNLLAVVAYRQNDQTVTEITQHLSAAGQLSWTVPAGSNYRIYVITTREGYLLHPDHGKELTGVYFDRFEKRMGDAVSNGMNYFFQDELYYPLRIGSWSNDFRDEFSRRKGYDITPWLPALHEFIGKMTPKVRLDYCDVLLDLAEERYFRPVYDWHADRGLIYGSDNLGRGKEPLAYVDYFRANSWYTAPGNDAPSKGSSFLQTKVSASIAHLYERPRTWLEAFHSMGWGSSGSWLTQQMDHHVIAGGNLVCMHGLYYSTHGGWWEWAPPCFHFRMPYWPHVKKWLEYTERLSYLMSQGTHVCDIALMYPAESMQAYPEAGDREVFDLAMTLSNAGLDYDFINYVKLHQAVATENGLTVSGERYKILMLADMQAMHHSSLQKALEHYRAGGIVLATGHLPRASTLTGEDDPQTDAIIRELFGLTAVEAAAGKTGEQQTNTAGGVGFYLPQTDVIAQIRSLITPDFRPAGGVGKVLHRRAGQRDVYMVMDVPKGEECFFRATGKVELWNASDGTTAPCPVVRRTSEGTWLRIEKESSNSSLFVFSPGTPVMADARPQQMLPAAQFPIDGEWETELLPTMNNRWGDFRFPAFDGYIGAEARAFRHQPEALSGKDWMLPGFDDSVWPESVYGFGPQMITCNRTDDESVDALVETLKSTEWPDGQPWEFSWQYGVWDQPGAQGWHGLKGKVSDGFLLLDQGAHQLYKTHVYVPQKGVYRIETDGVRPAVLLIDKAPADGRVTLDKGWHPLAVVYPNTRKTDFTFATGSYRDARDRSAVVLFPASSPTPEHPAAYDPILSMRWGLGDHLMYDPYGGNYRVWNYRFRAAPGLNGMTLTVAGKIRNVWFDGKPVDRKNIRQTGKREDGIRTYEVVFGQARKRVGVIAFSIERENGYQGAAVLCEPVELHTGAGLLATGNWSETGALKYYSGGMYYRKSVELPEVRIGGRVVLDLGELTASCELTVNGQPAGILMSPPYQADITSYVRTGANRIEILVYSTLSNHYQTIPTPYRGDGRAGLIGPVSMIIY